MKANIDKTKRFWVRNDKKVIATFRTKASANAKWYDIACCNASTTCKVWDNERKQYV